MRNATTGKKTPQVIDPKRDMRRDERDEERKRS